MPKIAVPADAHAHIPESAVDATITALTRAARAPELLQPAPGARDARARITSVDPRHSMVVFVIDGGPACADVLFVGTYPTADACRHASSLRLRVHPASGVPFVMAADTTPFEHSLSAETPSSLRLPLTSLGIDPQLAEAAMARDDSAELLELAARAPQRSQGETLRCLAAGHSPEAVREILNLAPVDLADVDTDAGLHAALRTPASLMNYALLDADESGDLQWMLRGITVEEWRAFLHPAQRREVERTTSGPARVTGGAGTGKTVVLLHRARMLAGRYPGSRIVLTTYTRNLADKMRSDLLQLDPSLPMARHLGDPGIYVAGIDSIAFAVTTHNRARTAELSERLLGRRLPLDFAIETDTAPEKRWDEAIAVAGADLAGIWRHSTFTTQEYEAVILPGGLVTAEAYRRTRRPARDSRLDRTDRTAVWEIVEEYRSSLRAQGLIDFAECVALAAELLAVGDSVGPLADHLLVDEGQDLSACHWRLARRMTAPGPDDIFVAEDAHQRIYARHVVPRAEGVTFTSAKKLALNYRTTEQNLRWALGVIDGHAFVDLAGDQETHQYRATRSGQIPTCISYEGITEERNGVAEIVAGWLQEGARPQDIAVLVRSKYQLEDFAAALRDARIPVADSPAHGRALVAVSVMTMHRAKGTEFPRIVIAGAGSDHLPPPAVAKLTDRTAPTRLAADADSHNARLRERSLVYVAATRARDALVVTCAQSPSEFLNPKGWADPARSILRSRPLARGIGWTARPHDPRRVSTLDPLV